MIKDYNTQRKKLILPEYGRNIQKMVDYIKTIEDKEQRNKLARQLINFMGALFPYLRDIPDFKHKLWDHLAIMSDFNLNIDPLYELPTPQSFHEKPKIIPLSTSLPRYKHYGKNLENFIKRAAELEEGPEKTNLIFILANHMKKAYLLWNKDTVDDTLIIDDIKTLSKGKIILDKDTRLIEAKDVLGKTKKNKKLKKG
jgi:hypothetical protein